MGPLGILRRRHRLEGAESRFFLLALDHGLPTGPITGLERAGELVRLIGRPSYSGAIVNPGMARIVGPALPPTVGLVVHLSAGTVLGSAPNSKVLSSSVEHAVGLGADAVSLQVSFDDPHEDRVLTDAGQVVDDANALGVPVLVMAYAQAGPGESGLDAVEAAHAARAAAELGASIVQTNYAGDPLLLRRVVKGCPVPVIVAGGPPSSSENAFLDALRESIRAGAAGASVGRRIFQAKDPAEMARRVAAVVFEEHRTIVAGAVR